MNWTVERPYSNRNGFRILSESGKAVASGICRDEKVLQTLGAAEDLLAACQAVQRAVDVDQTHHAMVMVRTAIAKAEGQKVRS